MFGSEASPVRQVEEDEQKAGKFALDSAKALSDLAMQPDRAALLKAQARTQDAHGRLYGSMADEHELKTGRARKFADAIAGAELPKDPGEAADYMARMAAGVGDLDGADKAYRVGSQIRLAAAQGEHQMATAAKERLAADHKKLELTESILRSSTDEASWRRNQVMYTLLTREPSPFAGVPFSPEILKTLGTSVLSKKDELANAIKAVEEKGRNWRAQLASRDRALQRDLSDEHFYFDQDRRERLGKVGGRAAASPSQNEQDAALVLLNADAELKGLPATERSRAIYDIASRAKEIRAQNRAIGSSQALQMALKEARDAGDFERGGGFEIPLIGKVGESTRYRGGGKTAGTALEPPLVDGRPDAAAFRKGRFYSTPKGPAKYLGEGKWELAGEEED